MLSLTRILATWIDGMSFWPAEEAACFPVGLIIIIGRRCVIVCCHSEGSDDRVMKDHLRRGVGKRLAWRPWTAIERQYEKDF